MSMRCVSFSLSVSQFLSGITSKKILDFLSLVLQRRGEVLYFFGLWDLKGKIFNRNGNRRLVVTSKIWGKGIWLLTLVIS